MKPTQVIEQVRLAREALARRFNYDIRAICHFLRQRAQEQGHQVVTLPPRRPVMVSTGPIK